jgi:phosphomevalonate kinase
MLAGEYAVLHQRPALVMAVDRYAVAEIAPAAPHEALPHEARVALALALNERVVTEASTRDVVVSVAALQGDGARKLGLGSSAAACVAALGLAYLRSGGVLDATTRPTLARLARRAHRMAQGGGSGVDVLASALGSVVHATHPHGLDGEPVFEAHPGLGTLPWVVLWSGTPARTSDMIARVDALRTREPERVAQIFDAIADATRAFDCAAREGSAPALVHAVLQHATAMRALGDAAGTPIVTGAMAQIAAAIEPLGAALKPSGAGGGDVAIAFARDMRTLGLAIAVAEAEGFSVVPLSQDGVGVAVA